MRRLAHLVPLRLPGGHGRGLNMGVLLKILLFPLLLVLMAVTSLFAASEDYTDVVEKNWDLSLPRSAGEMYSADSGASFLGDGYRYHVLEYADGGELTEILARETEELSSVPAQVTAILDALSVPEDQRPDFDGCRCFAVSDPADDRDKGYLLLSGDGARLYVVECFL